MCYENKGYVFITYQIGQAKVNAQKESPLCQMILDNEIEMPEKLFAVAYVREHEKFASIIQDKINRMKCYDLLNGDALLDAVKECFEEWRQRNKSIRLNYQKNIVPRKRSKNE